MNVKIRLWAVFVIALPFLAVNIHCQAKNVQSSLDDWFFSSEGVNGGSPCAACTLVVSIISQTSQYYKISPSAAMTQICGYFGKEDIIFDACNGINDALGPIVSYLLNKGYDPDQVCFEMKVCTNQTGNVCHLYPDYDRYHDHDTTTKFEDIIGLNAMEKFKVNLESNSKFDDEKDYNSKARARSHQFSTKWQSNMIDFCNITGVKPVCDIISRWSNDHMPVEDVDKDGFR